MSLYVVLVGQELSAVFCSRGVHSVYVALLSMLYAIACVFSWNIEYTE